MSHYAEEHRRLKPVLDLAARFDVTSSADPRAVYEPGNTGFQLWALPHDKPSGWDSIVMDTGAYAQPCKYVASVRWGWAGDRIVCLILSSDAYALRDVADGRAARVKADYYHNRPEDLTWARAKIAWLFEQAQVALPPIKLDVETT